MYLPSDMTGTVTFVAEVDNGDCVFGTGMATATGVQAGETTKAIDLVVMPTAQCTPIHDGGAGASGTAGTSGAAGVSGSAGGAGTGTRGQRRQRRAPAARAASSAAPRARAVRAA